MLHSILVVSQGSEFPTDVVQKLFELIQATNGIDLHTLHNLSPNKALDFIVQLEDDDDAEGIINHITLVFKTFESESNQGKDQSDRIDVILQPHDESRKAKKLFVFDMDSTLIKQEVIELIAAYAGVEDKVRDITEAAMRGELDFNQSLAQRVALLKGIESSKLWDELEEKIVITPGAQDLVKALKKLGVKTAVLSGGFIPLASRLQKTLGLDHAHANNLVTEVDSATQKEVLAGKTEGEIVNGEKKAELLQRIAKDHGIDVKDAVAVGDGANDLKMMGVAGWGIAWNAKPKVQKEAQCALNSNSLLDILYILGFADNEIKELLT